MLIFKGQNLWLKSKTYLKTPALVEEKGEEKVNTSWKFCHFASLSPVARLSASDLQTPSSAAPIHPLPFLQDMAVGCGAGKRPVQLSPVEPPWCGSPASEVPKPQCRRAVARQDTDGTACRALTITVFHCFGLRDRASR